jgi:lysozyme
VTTPALLEELRRDEGFRERAYQDTKGVWTCGFGHAHVMPGTVWTLAVAEQQLAIDVVETEKLLDREIPWWRRLDDVRQDALANMAFNIGVGGVLEFHHALAALQVGDWHAASAALHLSDWAKDPPAGVGERATRIIDMIRTGERP